MAKRGRPIIHWDRYRYDEEQNRWVRKKRYKHPVITVVKLDPEQALLVTCKTDGGYFFAASHPSFCRTRGGGPTPCLIHIRGRYSPGRGPYIDTQPS